MPFQKILDVGPADIPGMDFMTRSTVSGYQVKRYSVLVFFSAQDRIKILLSWNNGELILRARRTGDSQILQLIPRPKLRGDFPRHFIDQYVHWLDLGTGELEFRPTGSPWTSAPSNWRLYLHELPPRATFQKPSRGGSPIKLIDIHSITFGVVSSVLLPLESPENIIVTHTAQSLEVSLPRLHLLFFVNPNGELECRSMPNYIVDKTQSCGTMFGLRNKLILCPKPNSSEESLLPRRVIIPRGKVSYCTTGDFTSISINTDAEQQVRWHEYTIDTDLGCLTSNTSLRSKLYQCYLHALTSHCLPDPLLGHTGTEEALYMLQSAAFQSFQRLDGDEAKLLKLICNLTPKRVYYPSHLRSMATVKWNDLPALSQHHDFFAAARAVLDHARVLETLYNQPVVFDTPDRNLSLLKRAASRNKVYYPSDLQTSENLSSLDDVQYRSRDICSHGTAEHRAYQTSCSIWHGRPSLDGKLSNLWDIMNSWGSIGPASSGITLGYSQYWFKFDAARDWFIIYNLCRRPVNGGLQSMKIKLSFCLPAVTYSDSEYSNIIPFFVAFALDERFRSLSPPPDPFYTLSDNTAPNLAYLMDLVTRSALSMESSPVGILHVQEGPSMMAKMKWRMEEYNVAIQRESSRVANAILHHWLDYESVDFREQWFDKAGCIRLVSKYIQSILRNIRLGDHVQQLQSILQNDANISILATEPYEFSPQFIPSCSKAPSYSIRDTLLSHTNVPAPRADSAEKLFLRDSDSLAATTTGTVSPIAPDSLKVLVEEFRNSKQPLLELYGNDLNKSHRELMGHDASQSTRGPIPSHELLHIYHDDCLRKKDKLFSEISATLAPSQNVEQASAIAGLWPRITPRSLLRLLAKDRIATLPDQWKAVITHYAICLLEYQQSQRMLELSSSQKSEELLRELESLRSDVLAESTPDWLLVQVRPLCCKKNN